jgi:hypothetical protein
LKPRALLFCGKWKQMEKLRQQDNPEVLLGHCQWLRKELQKRQVDSMWQTHTCSGKMSSELGRQGVLSTLN